MSHCQDQTLRILEKHEDRFDEIGRRQDRMLKVLENHGSRLGKIEAKRKSSRPSGLDDDGSTRRVSKTAT